MQICANVMCNFHPNKIAKEMRDVKRRVSVEEKKIEKTLSIIN